MFLKDLITAYLNIDYSKNHIYRIPQKRVDGFIDTIAAIEVKSRAYIRVLLGKRLSSEPVDALISVESKGVWVCCKSEGRLDFYNYVTLHQAKNSMKKNEKKFIEQVILFNK